MGDLLLVLALLFILVGIAGAVLPIIPGPPIAFVGLLCMHFAGDEYKLSGNALAMWGILALVITILDFVVPIYGTKKFGGTKWGTRGSTLGLLVGIFASWLFGPLAPFAIIIGPFVGAVIGELAGGATQQNAIRSGIGAFLGFLAGVFMKFVYAFAALLNLILTYF